MNSLALYQPIVYLYNSEVFQDHRVLQCCGAPRTNSTSYLRHPGTRAQKLRSLRSRPSSFWALGPVPGPISIMAEQMCIKGDQEAINKQYITGDRNYNIYVAFVFAFADLPTVLRACLPTILAYRIIDSRSIPRTRIAAHFGQAGSKLHFTSSAYSTKYAGHRNHW